MSLNTICSLFAQNPPEQRPKVLSDPKFFTARTPYYAGAQAYSTPVLPFVEYLDEADDECRVVSLVMLKCLGGSEHDVGGVIVKMPGIEGAHAVLTFEKANRPDESIHRWKGPTRIPTSPPEEVDIITTYNLPKSTWSPGDLVELLKLDPKENNTEKYFPHPHIPNRKSTRYTYVYSIDFDNPSSLIDFLAVLSLVSAHRKNQGGSLSLVNTCTFFVAAVCKVAQIYFGGSEIKMNKDIYPTEPYTLETHSSKAACMSHNEPLKWFGITHPPSWFLGSAVVDTFGLMDTDDAGFKRVVDELVSQIPAALEAYPGRRRVAATRRWETRAIEEYERRTEEERQKLRKIIEEDVKTKSEQERRGKEEPTRERELLVRAAHQSTGTAILDFIKSEEEIERRILEEREGRLAALQKQVELEVLVQQLQKQLRGAAADLPGTP